jgi:transposase
MRFGPAPDRTLSPLRGSITPILRWLQYADHRVARLRRSCTGSITAIIQWLDYADPGMARICRSVTARTPELLATRFIKLIGKLFAGESRSQTWTPERRQRLRRRYSARVLDAIHTLMIEESPGVVPKSLLGKALTYLRAQWPKLIRYVENGDWPISNNPCENAIRPFCVGRRGWLFSDTVDGANASANLYTLVETCKANGIDPYRYLTWLFQRLPLAKTIDDYDALLPWKMPDELR